MTTLVTGGAGLVGSAFVRRLLEQGVTVRTVRHRTSVPAASDVEVLDGDLLDADICLRACRGADTVIHAAGVSGGSKEVTVNGIPMFTDNLLMNTQMLEAARQAGVERYLFVSNSSVYARSTEVLREEDAWGETSRSIPENETGMVKRAGESQCGLYARFTEMRIAIMRGANTYGPHDDFDLNTSHVVPALIRKAVEGQDPYMVWGSPAIIRDFIHSDDLARGGLLLLAAALPQRCDPVNVATGTAVSIAELVRIVLHETGRKKATVQWDDSAPVTSPAKRLDTTRMAELGFVPQVPLDQGLRQTIAWYRENRS